MGCDGHYYFVDIELYELQPKVNFSELYNELNELKNKDKDEVRQVLREKFEDLDYFSVDDFIDTLYAIINDDGDYLYRDFFKWKKVSIPDLGCGCSDKDSGDLYCSTDWLDEFEDIDPYELDCVTQTLEHATYLARRNNTCYLVDVTIRDIYDCGLEYGGGDEYLVCSPRIKEEADKIYDIIYDKLIRSRYR